MNKSRNFIFHETFQPQIMYLAEILKLANDEFKGNKREISDLTGIPTGEASGKVIPHIKYLIYMGLIQEVNSFTNIELKLTDLGMIIYTNDQYLMEDISKIAINYNLSRINKGAPQWSFLFREYEYEIGETIKLKLVQQKADTIFAKDLKITPIKSMYSSKGDFYNIRTIDIIDDSVSFKSVYPSYENYNLYAYCLLKEWEEIFADLNEITLSDITQIIKWDKGFSFDKGTMLEVLDEIMSRGFIKLNKQLDPITIIKTQNSHQILNLIYDDLI